MVRDAPRDGYPVRTSAYCADCMHFITVHKYDRPTMRVYCELCDCWDGSAPLIAGDGVEP
jgi:hypothetical protein